MSYGGGRSEKSSNTLYVNGFGPDVRAKDLAYEFERFGRLVRCDIPAPKNPDSRPFAFIEYEDRRDAADAYDHMHKKTIGRDVINVEFAKNTPSTNWRRDEHRGPPPRRYDDRRHDRRDDRAPPAGRYDRDDRRDSRGPPPGRYDDRPRNDDRRPPPRGRSVSPNRGSRRGSVGSAPGKSPIVETANGRAASPANERPLDNGSATPEWDKAPRSPPPVFVEDSERSRLDD